METSVTDIKQREALTQKVSVHWNSQHELLKGAEACYGLLCL